MLTTNEIITYKILLKLKICYFTYIQRILSFFHLIPKYSYIDIVTNYPYNFNKKQEIEYTNLNELKLYGYASFTERKFAEQFFKTLLNKNMYCLYKCIIPKGSQIYYYNNKEIKSSNIIIKQKLHYNGNKSK